MAIGIGAPISIFLNWLLIYGPERVQIGYCGAAWAAVVAYNLILIILVIYAMIELPKGVWAGFSRASFQELSQNYAFGFAGVVALCSEWWGMYSVIQLEYDSKAEVACSRRSSWHRGIVPRDRVPSP